MVLAGCINLVLAVYFVRSSFTEKTGKTLGGLAAMLQQHRNRNEPTEEAAASTYVEESRFRPRLQPASVPQQQSSETSALSSSNDDVSSR